MMGKFGCLMLFGMEILILLLLLAGVAPPQGVEAWGKEGHYSTCKIAEPLLSKEAKEAVTKLLPEYAKGDLASLCSWPDQMRFRFHWANSLHYINTPDNQCGYDYDRDCHDEHGVKGVCLEGAIKNYTSQLQTYGSAVTGGKNLTQALLFLSHFMGDVHEPLHVGFTSDEGGNTINLHWYRRKCNLHHVWDSFIIEKAMKEYYDNDLEVMIEAVQKKNSDSWSDEVPTWEKCNGHEVACPGSYADESIIIACKWAYKDAKENSVLEDDYFLSRLPILEKQLAKGGVRLAATLNRIFSSKEGYTRDSEL